MGVVAQLGEHLPCTQGVRSSILLDSTKHEKSFVTIVSEQFVIVRKFFRLKAAVD